MHSLPVDSIGQMGCLDPPFLQWQVLLLSRLTPIRYSGMYVRGRHRESRVKWKHQADLSINFALQVTVFTFIEAERAPSRLTMSLQSSTDQWHVIVQKKSIHISILYMTRINKKLNTVLTTQRPPPLTTQPNPHQKFQNPRLLPQQNPHRPLLHRHHNLYPLLPHRQHQPMRTPPKRRLHPPHRRRLPRHHPRHPRKLDILPQKTPTYSPRNSTPASDPTPPPTATRPPPLQAARRA